MWRVKVGPAVAVLKLLEAWNECEVTGLICKGASQKSIGHCAIVTCCVKYRDISIQRFLLARFAAGKSEWWKGNNNNKNLVLFYSSKYLYLHNFPSLCASLQGPPGRFCSKALLSQAVPEFLMISSIILSYFSKYLITWAGRALLGKLILSLSTAIHYDVLLHLFW